jgi:predicted permease
LPVITITLICVVVVFALALMIAFAMGLNRGTSGTFTQCSFQGNLGYIGFAVIFYFLGDGGLVTGSIIGGLVMILHNSLAVLTLQMLGRKESASALPGHFFSNVAVNPVILSALFGIGYAWLGWPLPPIIDRTLKIVAAMALPLALLLIGATLSLTLVKKQWLHALWASLIKLLIMPAIGVVLFNFFGLSSATYLPALILLAAPPATVTFVFAKEMHGDADLAAATISMGTILSGLTYIVWLHFFG